MVLVATYAFAVGQGRVAQGTAPNLSDFFVAQYLSGHIGMRPADFEWTLSLRDTVIRGLLAPAGWIGFAVLGLLAVGHLALVGRFAVNARRLRRILRSSYAWRRFGRLHLCLTDSTQVLFSTRGLRNHYIIIPAALLSDKPGLQMAIAHELRHMRQVDVGWEIGLKTLRLMFFLEPGVPCPETGVRLVARTGLRSAIAGPWPV